MGLWCFVIAIVIENIKNEYFVFDPHSRCISGLSNACHLSIHKSMVELCCFLCDLPCSLTDKARNKIQYDLQFLHMKHATETQQKKAYNVQPELIDSLSIAIIENIWPKVG